MVSFFCYPWRWRWFGGWLLASQPQVLGGCVLFPAAPSSPGSSEIKVASFHEAEEPDVGSLCAGLHRVLCTGPRRGPPSWGFTGTNRSALPLESLHDRGHSMAILYWTQLAIRGSEGVHSSFSKDLAATERGQGGRNPVRNP